jgi:MFS family permease
MARLPGSVRFLLLCALILTIGRAMSMPFMTIYLSRQFALNQQQVGLIMGASLLFGTFAGLYCGYLTDRFDKRWLVYLAVGLVAASFVLAPVLHSALLILLILAAANSAFSLIDIALKSFFADLLPPEQRGKAFSLRYMLANVGWASGPMLGTLMVGHDVRWPFWMSCAVTVAGLLLLISGHGMLRPRLDKTEAHSQVPDFSATVRVLKSDGRLVLFTLGGVFSAFVYSKFSVYLSQYAVTVSSPAYAYRLLSAMLVTNGLGVILLQYPIGSRIKQHTLMRWVSCGSLALTLSMLIFMQSTALPVWVIGMVVLTLGEVSLVPAEYLFIDVIAPEHLRGSYYGAQNLANIGSALSPLLCGIVLTHAPAVTMFWVQITLTMTGAGLFYLGYRKMRQGVPMVGLSPGLGG